MNKNPHLLEINVRVWLNRLGKGKKLSSVSDEQIDRWKALGYDLLWLMGIWKNNEDVTKKYCFEPELIAEYNSALKDWKDEDVIGSPYAIDKYEINPALGSYEDIIDFKERLNKKGIKLILDFISNHFSAQSSLIRTNKERCNDGN